MQILRFLILGLLIPSVCYGWGVPVMIGGGPAASGGASCTVDTDSQQVPFSSSTALNSETTISSTALRGERFTLSAATEITGFEVIIGDTSSDVGTTTAYLYAYDTTNDEPTGSALASVAVANSALPNTQDTHFFEFDSVYSASSGEYCIYLVGSGGGTSNITRDNGATDDGTAHIYSNDSGSTWAENTGRDLRGDGIFGCN